MAEGEFLAPAGIMLHALARRFAALAMVLVLLPSGCSPGSPSTVEMEADSAAGEVAFQLAGAQGAALMVPVHINGEGPFDFIFDTGASFSCVSDSIVRQLALRERPLSFGVTVGVGGSERLRLVQLDSFRIGGTTARDLPACIVDLGQTQVVGFHADGLVGLNFMRELDVSLDFRRRILTLSRPD